MAGDINRGPTRHHTASTRRSRQPTPNAPVTVRPSSRSSLLPTIIFGAPYHQGPEVNEKQEPKPQNGGRSPSHPRLYVRTSVGSSSRMRQMMSMWSATSPKLERSDRENTTMNAWLFLMYRSRLASGNRENGDTHQRYFERPAIRQPPP